MGSTSSSTSCAARFATPPAPGADLAGKVARVAAALGTDLMGWQRQVLEAGTGLDGGRLRYRQVCVLVPRQSGKSTLALALMVAYALARPRTKVVYVAQTRLDARTRLVDDWIPAIEASPLAPKVRARRGFGTEALLFANGSKIGLVAGTRTGGHGATLDLAVIDEAWSQVDARLEQALKPTMVTRTDPQTWILSTAGDDSSSWLRAKVDAGRTACQVGQFGAAAYFEWSAESGADPADPAVWRSCMPALGETTPESAIAADLGLMDRGEFCRAYLNWWPEDAAGGWDVFSRQKWDACGYPG
jgi:phage terminase large subunit-like protein